MVFNLRNKSKELQTLYFFPILLHTSSLFLLFFIIQRALMLDTLLTILTTLIIFFLMLISIDSASYILKHFKRMKINTFSEAYLIFRLGYAYLLTAIYIALIYDVKIPFRIFLLIFSPLFLISPSILVHGPTIRCIKERDKKKLEKCRENLLCKNYIQLLPKPKTLTICEEYEEYR